MKTKIKARWLGHSAFRIESPAGNVIYIDPFLSGNSTTPEQMKNPDDIDYILLTHGHEDHVGDTVELAKKTGCKVVAQVELSQLLIKSGVSQEQSIEFNKGGTVDFEDFSVTLVSANHSSSFGGEYAGEAGGLVISFEDDLCFYHLGDTNIFGDLQIYGELYEPHVIAVPIGDHYTMGPEEAARCCEMINANIAIPIHYGTFPVLKGSPDEFKEFTEEFCDTEVWIPEPGEQFLGK